MTEKEWMNCEDPIPMLYFLEAVPDSRKVLLLTSASLRQVWDLLPQSLHRWAFLAEESADGRYSLTDLPTDQAERDLYARCESVSDLERRRLSAILDLFRADWQINLFIEEGDNPIWEGERTEQANLLRDIFGNPFRPVTLDPKCLTLTAQSLALAIYNDRSFARLPILADALEEAGCDTRDVLNHLRSGGDHVRGCWALDLVLGRE